MGHHRIQSQYQAKKRITKSLESYWNSRTRAQGVCFFSIHDWRYSWTWLGSNLALLIGIASIYCAHIFKEHWVLKSISIGAGILAALFFILILSWRTLWPFFFYKEFSGKILSLPMSPATVLANALHQETLSNLICIFDIFDYLYTSHLKQLIVRTGAILGVLSLIIAALTLTVDITNADHKIIKLLHETLLPDFHKLEHVLGDLRFFFLGFLGFLCIVITDVLSKVASKDAIQESKKIFEAVIIKKKKNCSKKTKLY